MENPPKPSAPKPGKPPKNVKQHDVQYPKKERKPNEFDEAIAFRSVN